MVSKGEKLSTCGVMYSCRVCMEESKEMVKIFDYDSANCDTISERITFCTGLEITKEDGLPDQICTVCYANLSVSHKFKTTCIHSDQTYHRLLKSVIKKEVFDKTANFQTLGQYDDDVHDADNYLNVEFLVADKGLVKVEANVLQGETSVKKAKGPRVKKEKRATSKKKKKIKTEATARSKRAVTQKRAVKQKRASKLNLYCEICDMTFEERKQFTEHRKLMHKKTSWVCEICGKVFRHQSSQSLHQLAHKEPRYQCNHCDYKTTYRQDLVTHLRRHSGIKLHKCHHCGLSFSTSSNRSAHIQRVHEPHTRPTFSCHLCGKTVCNKVELNYHLDSHADVKRFCCEVCNTRFLRRKHWKRHMSVQHGIVIPVARSGRRKEMLPEMDIAGPRVKNLLDEKWKSIKKHKCPHCELTFSTTSNRNSHVQRNHEPHLRPAHTCHICGKSLCSGNELKYHLESHAGVRRYSCDICETKFRRRWHWKRHLRVQHSIIIPNMRSGKKKEDLLIIPDRKTVTPSVGALEPTVGF